MTRKRKEVAQLPASSTLMPASVRDFVNKWTTVPVAILWPDMPVGESCSIYSESWYRAVAAMMLSGRIQPTSEGRPNRTDALRFCKEANFNPAWLDELAWFLVQARIILPKQKSGYHPGPALLAFDRHDFIELKAPVHDGVLKLLQEYTGSQVRRPTSESSARMIEFVTLFAAAFPGVGVRESDLFHIWRGLSELPVNDLVEWAMSLGITLQPHEVSSWHQWFDQKGVPALRQTLYSSRWAYVATHLNEIWFALSFDAQSMLGQIDPLPSRELTATLEVDDKGKILAGAGLPITTLAGLCKLCRVTKIRPVMEFQIDEKRMAQLPVSESPRDELRELLLPAGALTSGVEKLLGGETLRGGHLTFAQCNAVIIPDNDEVAKAIRKHPRLKGYLATNAPAGLLLIKPESDPRNFLLRCRELGFIVDFR